MEIFPSSLYAKRLHRVASIAHKHGLDACVFGTGPELAYLTGSWITSHERFTGLVVPTEGTPVFIAPSVDRGEIARSAIAQLDVTVQTWEDGEDPYQLASDTIPSPKKIGLGSSLIAPHVLALQARTGAETVLATPLLAELFMRKDAAEVQQLRDAAQAIDAVHTKVPALLQAGRTEAEVASDIHQLILDTGHSEVDFVIVGSGENGANAHHDYSDRVLQQGDIVVVDLGGTWGVGYHSDCTRTYVVGGPRQSVSQEFIELYDVLQRAQEKALAAVKPGVAAEKIDKVARSLIDAAGYGSQFIHRTGHGIGLSTHEEPFIQAGNSLVLEPGMAFSVEPGIYVPGKWGARIEDIVVVTEDGTEVLNHNTRSLQ